jgi:hypothetical protein
MYVNPNFKTKKDLKTAIQDGKRVEAFSPGPFPCPKDGRVTIEGPHFPQPHRWYAQVDVVDGIVVKVIS